MEIEVKQVEGLEGVINATNISGGVQEISDKDFNTYGDNDSVKYLNMTGVSSDQYIYTKWYNQGEGGVCPTRDNSMYFQAWNYTNGSWENFREISGNDCFTTGDNETAFKDELKDAYVSGGDVRLRYISKQGGYYGKLYESLIANDTKKSFSCSSGIKQTELFELADLGASQSLTVYANDSLGNVGSNTTNWEYKLFEEANYFEDPVLETSKTNITVQFESASDYSVNDGALLYNNHTFDSTIELVGTNKYNVTSSFYVPGGTQGFDSENRTFDWNISIQNINTGTETFIETTEHNQTVNELRFGLCGGTLDETLVNFSYYDEKTAELINGSENATTFQGTFKLGANEDNKLKNYSINNQSTDKSHFAFCTDEPENEIYADMNALYTATNYVERQYFLTNSLLDNETSNISLQLLKENDALEFFVYVEKDLSPLQKKKVAINKYFVGEGVYKTTSITETDSGGEFSSSLDLDKEYQFIFYDDEGNVIGKATKKASCKAAPCELEIILAGDEDGANLWSGFSDEFAGNVKYNLSFSQKDQEIVFDFVDTSGEAQYFRLGVEKVRMSGTNNEIFSKKLYTTSGRITYNTSNLTKGTNVIASAYVSRSPETFIDSISPLIKGYFAGGNDNVVALFMAFLTIILIIFSFSFKPSGLVLSVPLALTTIKLMNLIEIGWDVIVPLIFISLVILYYLND